MSNIKDVNIVADVPFDYLNWKPDGGLPEAEIAVIASALLSPSGGLEYAYRSLGYVPNDHGGQTAMYRLTITGQEALPHVFLQRLVRALENSGPTAVIQVAEARDLEFSNNEPWVSVV